MLRRVDVGRPQIGHQQVIAGEHIQRQEAIAVVIAVVIAVEEAPLLMAVHRIVGGIHVQHNLFGRPLEGGDEGRGQNLVNRPRPIPFGPVLEAAQRRRAGQSPVAPGRRLHGKVMAQGAGPRDRSDPRSPAQSRISFGAANPPRHGAACPVDAYRQAGAPPPPSGQAGNPPDATATHRHCSSPHRRRNPPRPGARDRLEKKADQRYNPSPPRSRVRFCLTN